MTDSISDADKIILRTPGQWSKPMLMVFKPSMIYTAVLAVVPDSNDIVYEVEYNTGSGTLANVKSGMQMWVGTTAGAGDLGVCRIRKAPDATYFYIGAISKIDWATAGTIYLTIVDIFPLIFKPVNWAGPSMDWDVDYSDQHENFDPVVLLGPPPVINLDVTSTVTFPDVVDSWVIGSTITGYLFESDAGTWTNPTTSGAILNIASYPTNGHINVYCTLTAANGKSFTRHVYVFVYNAAHPATTTFQLTSNPKCDAGSNGWDFSMTLSDNASQTDIREGTLVVLFADDWYGGTKQSIGSEAGRENIITWGWITGESIVWDIDSGSVDFQVLGPAGWLKQIPIYVYDMKFKKNTTKWNEMPDLNVQRALYNLLHWRTTATAIMDVQITDDARTAPLFQAIKGNVWGQIAEIGKSIFCNPGCDRYGRLFVYVDAQIVPVTDRTWETIMTITSGDGLNTINLKKITIPPSSMLPMSGLETNASGHAVTRYSLAVGHIPLDTGNMEASIDKVLVADQEQANMQCELVLGQKINPWPEILIVSPMNNRFIDCWPNQFLALSLDAGETPREEGFSGNLVPRAVELVWDMESNSFGVSVNSEAESFPAMGMNGDIPPIPPDPEEPPTPPPPPVPPPPPDPGNDPYAVLLAGTNSMATDLIEGLLYTENFNDTDPEWNYMNEGLTEAEYTNVCQIERCPSGLILIAIMDPVLPTIKSIYYASALGDVWTKLIDDTMVDQGSYSTPAICALGVNPNKNEEIMVVGGGWDGLADGRKMAYMGTRSGLTEVAGNWDITNYPAGISYGMGKWLLTRARASALNPHGWARIGAGGVLEAEADYTTPFAWASSAYHLRRGGKVFQVCANTGGYLRVISDNDPTVEVYYTLPISDALATNRIAISPTGAQIIEGHITGATYYSIDEGANWSALPGIGVAYRAWENCESEDTFIGAAGGNIQYTPDFGTTWIAKSGNLASLNNLYVVQHIKYIAG